MSDLNGLLNALVTVVVHYRDDKLSLPRQDANTLKNLIEKPLAELQKTLTEMIESATQKDKTRKPLLDYIVYNIALIKPLLENAAPKLDTENIKSQVRQFIQDIQTLMINSQSVELTINYNLQRIKMYGLQRSMLRGYSLCISGTLLQDNVFKALDNVHTAKIEEIKRSLDLLFCAHEISCLKSENQKLSQKNQLLLTENSELKQEKEIAQDKARSFKTQSNMIMQQPKQQEGFLAPQHTPLDRGKISATPNRAPHLFSFWSDLIVEGINFLTEEEENEDSSNANSHNGN